MKIWKKLKDKKISEDENNNFEKTYKNLQTQIFRI